MENKSTLLKDAFALFVITLVSGLVLSLVYVVTKEPIEVQAEARKMRAYQSIYAEAEEFIEDEELFALVSEVELTDLSSDYEGIQVVEINNALDAEGNIIGYLVQLSTNKGYGGNISLAIGYSLDGILKGIETLEINETAGLGAKASEADFKDQFTDKKVDYFISTKVEATTSNEISAISGATVTTNAIVNAVNAGIDLLNKYSPVMEVE